MRFRSPVMRAVEVLNTLLSGRADRLYIGPDEPRADLLLPGSFNPLHEAHREMVRMAEAKLVRRAAFELSVANVDKPTLSEAEVGRRLSQFAPHAAVWLTLAPTFLAKAQLFPGAVFIVGADTVQRIADVRYYGDQARRRDEAIEIIAGRGCRFLVFGRLCDGAFRTLDNFALPSALKAICIPVTAAEFRRDISSTQLRAAPKE